MLVLWYLTFQECNPVRVLEEFLHGFHKSICAFKIYYIFAHLEERRREKKAPHGEHLKKNSSTQSLLKKFEPVTLRWSFNLHHKNP